MKLPISTRLLACAALVAPGDRVADIGCDHGYLSIHLLTNGIAASVIASDIRQGPLESAIRNAKKYGVQNKIQFYLSDGVQNIPRQFDTLICAGMGADTMISILSAAPWLKNEHYRLILQCQSKTPALRRYLYENGWFVDTESVLRDGHFLYTVMEARWQDDMPPISLGEFYCPSALLENPTEEALEYYHRTVNKLRLSVNGRGEQADPAEKQALAYLEDLSIPSPIKEDTL